MAHRVRTVSRIDPRPIKQEANRLWGLALTLAEGVHELRKGGGALDFEEYFVVVVCHLDVKVFAFRLFSVASSRGLVAVGHLVGCCRSRSG